MAAGNSASRLGEALQASPQKTNFTKLTRLLICGGTHALRELLDSIILPKDLTNKLRDPSVFRTLDGLRNRSILTKEQWNILYPSPPGVVVESKSFDITLLFKLLREICDLTAPVVTGWDKLPNSTNTTLEADLARIKHYRNTLYAHVNNMEIIDEDFRIYWSEIKEALLRIFRSISPTSEAEFERKIDDCLASSIAEEDSKDVKELKMWYMEEEISKNSAKLEEFDQKIKELKDSMKDRAKPVITVYPEITIQAVMKLASRGVWLAGSVYILNRYKDDPDNFLKMVKGFVLPTGVLVFAMTNGSIRLQIRVMTLNGLEEVWERYQSGQLEEDLEKVLVNECGLKEQANGDVVEVDVTICEDEYKKARELLKALQHSDEEAHEDSNSRYDKDDPSKSTEAANEDPDETMDEPKTEKRTDEDTQDPKSPTLKIIQGKQFKDGESIFQLHLAFITSLDQADQALKKLEKNSEIADASYRIQASRVFDEGRKSFMEKCDDYGSMNAGARLLRLLEMTDARNVVVILTCWYNGKLLQPVGRLISQKTLSLLRSSVLFEVKTPSKDKELLHEVEDYFEFIKQHVRPHPSIIPEQKSLKTEILHGKTIEVLQSIFQAHLAVITSQDQVERVLAELKKESKVSKATYNAYAYRIFEEKSCIEDFDDDGEKFAGADLLHLLKVLDVKDVIVIVTRWHGRIALGRTRFKYINQTALELLRESGLVKLESADVQKLLKKQEEYLEHLKQHCTSLPHTTLPPNNKIMPGEKLEDRKSTFQAHLAVISSREQVDEVFKELKKSQDIANATYNIQAYRIYHEDTSSMVQDCDDDGEYLAGASLLHLLEVLDVQNVMVTVSRWHGGIPLGRDRFTHIHQCALKLLQSEGIVESLTTDQEKEILSQLDKYFDLMKKNAVDYYTEIPKSSCPKIIHGAFLEDRKSTFQAHLAVVTCRDQVDQVLAGVKRDWLVAKATYNILAYRVFDQENDTFTEDFDDDGETGAGERLLSLLQQAGAKNMVAVVTRWHGDILLGTTRFRHINKCVSELLKLHPFGCSTNLPPTQC